MVSVKTTGTEDRSSRGRRGTPHSLAPAVLHWPRAGGKALFHPVRVARRALRGRRLAGGGAVRGARRRARGGDGRGGGPGLARRLGRGGGRGRAGGGAPAPGGEPGAARRGGPRHRPGGARRGVAGRA